LLYLQHEPENFELAAFDLIKILQDCNTVSFIVVMFRVNIRVNNGSGNDTGCFEIKVRLDAAKFTNMRRARFRQNIL